MKIATCEFKNLSPYSQGKHYSEADEPKRPQELAIDYEARTWRARCHVGPDGYIYIPAMAFSNNIKEAAKYLSIQIPGKGKATFTKNFDAGVLVLNHLPLDIHKDDVQSEWVFVPSDGIRGSGKRINKCFPVIPEWSGTVTYHIYDDLITPDVFARVVKAAGQLIGIGRFRPSNRGIYGRFDVVDMDWQEVEL